MDAVLGPSPGRGTLREATAVRRREYCLDGGMVRAAKS